MKSLILLAVAALAISTITQAQTPKRQVTVITADDKKYEGAFVKADDGGVTLETGDVQTTVKLESVKLIMFGGTVGAPEPTPTPPPVDTKSIDAAKRAVTALRKLQSATGVGINYLDYNRLVVDAKAVVDDELPKMEAGQLKDEIQWASLEYAFAAQVWYQFIQYPRAGIPTKSELGRTLIHSYDVQAKVSVFTSIPRDAALTAIWRKAGRHFNRAAELSSQ